MNNLQLASAEQILSGGGEMGRRMRAYDWHNSPLGDVQQWPQSLKTCVRILLTSRQAMFVWWGKKLINLYNDPYTAILGGKHPDALGMPATEVWREIWHQIEPRAKACMEKNEGTYDEALLLIMERNGYPEETYYTFSYSPVPGEDGLPAGIICANTDTTQRITGERQLRTLTGLAKNSIDSLNDQAVFDNTIRVLGENPHDFPFAFIYQLSADGHTATLAASTASMNHTLLPQEIHLQRDGDWGLQQVLDGNKTQVYNIPAGIRDLPQGAWPVQPRKALLLPLSAGVQKHPFAILVVGLNPYRLLNEQYAGFFQLVADQVMTGLGNVHALEEERKRAAALAAIDSAKTAFFSNISHEFRTPLTLMLGPLEELLQNDGILTPQQHEQLSATHRNALRLLRLVNSLLDFSRISAGRMQAAFEPVQLGAFTADLASSFRSVIEKAGLVFEVDCAILPQPVYVDTDMWEKIVLNLLSNAFKYTLHGSVQVKQYEANNQLVLQVADTGVGIPASELPRMFERFHRVENVTGRSHEGTGIGLSLVKELVELHGGTITVSSTAGKGSVFTVTLPLGYDHLPAQQVKHTDTGTTRQRVQTIAFIEEAMSLLDPDEANMATAANVVQDKDTLVLVVDDNADMRHYLERLLLPYYRVTTAANGALALEYMEQHQPALVISDIMMPVMDGIQLLHTLKQQPHTARIPVILLSARAGEEARIAGYETGADDYLVKPFSAKELLARVSAQLKLVHIRSQAEVHLRNLLLKAPVAISVVSGPSFVIDIANDKLLELWGKPAEAVVNKPLLEAWPEAAGQGVIEQLTQVYRTGERWIGHERETRLHRNNIPVTAYVNFVYEPQYDTEGKISGVMVVLHDVTELVNARLMAENAAEVLEQKVQDRTADLKASNEALLRTNQELEQFAYVASHDLQEPLRKIQIFSQLITSNQGKPAFNTAKYQQKVEASARRMSGLINDLLNFSRLGKSNGQFVQVNLNTVLQQVLNDFEVMITQKKARIHSDPLPVIKAIPIQMNQLLHNLVGNALKFSDDAPEINIRLRILDGQAVHIYPQLQQGIEYAELTVADNGIGFDPRYAEQIFVIFQRLNNGQQYSGTGIGLAVCKKIADNHHGIILAHSEPGKGSAFTIVLPVA
ncbi:sensor histidine kinase [Deminuibacter soli]|uniref:histidine kinase n=1 Tax=Deminuibacter soli TaxID=2291815 RepID=A0A3E1NH37_9BACT|nr:ATP-binding protein [Deminuibacter soli]RFM27192.1 response regulator [Deminuibacter soli]